MTTRDPRSRDPYRPEPPVARDPTQSLSLSPEDLDANDYDAADPAHPSLALGTHGAPPGGPVGPAGPQARTPGAASGGVPEAAMSRTSVASPGARARTPLPRAPSPVAAGRGRPPPVPKGAHEEPDRVGTVLGSYRITELLGKGGMGYVFRAEHVKLGREVALKLLRSDYARRRDAVARFFQEARTVNRVRHRNIVDVTDFVELEDGTTFIIMELLTGQSLGRWARDGIDLPRALAVLVQICDGLAAAHDVGVIHRDLKPDNIIVVPTPDGAELVKLLDFGVAKLVNRDDEDVGFQTAAGSVIGTPAYMSPEQAGGMPVDARSDIYSLGAIMYELFCGQPMFRGRSFGEYVRKHLTEPPIPPSGTPGGAQIDPRLEALILRCLEKDPIQRFPRITELRDAMFGMLGGMELPLPALASLSGSGVRALASVSLAPMPQLPPMGAQQHPSQPGLVNSGAHASQLSHPHPSHPSHPSQPSGAFYYGHGTGQMLPSTGVQPPRTPWWVWFVGGALAVGLGVGAAVWYAGRGDLPPAPASPPVAVKQPITAPSDPPAADPPAPAAPAAPARVEIKLDSLPAGTVYAEGSATELCRTPCTHAIDPKDGGSAERRTFIVRSDGYRDGTIVVDLSGTERAFQITLEPREVAAAPEGDPPATPDDKTPKPDDKTAGKQAGKPRPGGGIVPPRPVKLQLKTVKPDDKAAKPDDKAAKPDDKAAKPDDKAAKPDDKAAKPDTPPPSEPADPKPPKKKPGGTIDPTDTLDPFKPKKPS